MTIPNTTTNTTTTTTSTTNQNWVDSSNAPVPLESILTDIFLPNQQQLTTPQSSIDTASVAAAAAQMNGGSFIGSSIKTSEGLTFLALGRLSDKVPALPAPDSKGKTKMTASWTTPPRVLLVDDDSVYRDFSGRMLDRIGCNIDLANDGLEALRKMSVEKYDLILMVR
jgi:osomolarity two-component system response regulator SKN7